MGIGLPWRIDRSGGGEAPPPVASSSSDETTARMMVKKIIGNLECHVQPLPFGRPGQKCTALADNPLSRANRVSLSSSPPHARTQFCPNCLNLFHRSDPRRRRRRSFAGATTPDRGKVRIGSIDRLSSLCVVVASRSNSKQSNEEDPPFAGLLLALAFIIISVLLLLCSLPQAKIGGLGIGGGGCQCGWI
uniref:Uncharacterized protein n=1 Tax=Leersia perrieri TaxID=77586 RepID=A0A0D9VM36_9ORYZ